MIKKTLTILGGVFVVLIVFGIIVGILITALGGARNRSVQPISSGGTIAIENPLSAPGLPAVEEKTDYEVEPGSESSRLVIKTGTINMVVKDIKSSVENITNYVQDKEGWVVSSNVVERETIPSGSITVRVPADNFDETIAHFRGLAEKVTHESTQGQDVTEEYVDLQSQLRNLEATEAQLLKIMERSGTISEVLNVQRELTSVRSQIERLKGRIQYLEGSAEMATITVNLALSEDLLPIPPSEKWRPVYVIKRAWSSVFGSLRGISYLLIWIAIYGLIWVPLVAIVLLARRFWRKRKEPQA